MSDTGDERQPVAGTTIAEFLDGVAARQVAPSAGAVTAVNAASGAALCEMVAIHTSDPSAALTDAREGLAGDRADLLELADEDAAAVDRVQTAFETDTETDHPQAALERSTEVPLAIAETCGTVLERAVVVADQGTRNAVVDTVVGARTARTALGSAATIVRTNLELVEDEAFVADARARIGEAEATADESLELVQDAAGLD